MGTEHLTLPGRAGETLDEEARTLETTAHLALGAVGSEEGFGEGDSEEASEELLRP